jgi:hypothetical protein
VGIGVFPFFDVFYPGAVYPNGYIMLRLASHRAGMAADALAIVNNETVVHDNNPFKFSILRIMKRGRERFGYWEDRGFGIC